MLSNILFYLKNLLLNYYQTPKQIRHFNCFLCRNNYTFPITSKDYVVCNKCMETIAVDNV